MCVCVCVCVFSQDVPVFLFGFKMVMFPPKFMMNFDFNMVNFPFLDGDVSRRPSYGVYISHLIRFPRMYSPVNYFNALNKCLTA